MLYYVSIETFAGDAFAWLGSLESLGVLYAFLSDVLTREEKPENTAFLPVRKAEALDPAGSSRGIEKPASLGTVITS